MPRAYRVGGKTAENVTADIPFVKKRGLLNYRLRTPHRQLIPPWRRCVVRHWIDGHFVPATRRRAVREVLTTDKETVPPPAPLPDEGKEPAGGEDGWVNAWALLVTGAAVPARNGDSLRTQLT